MKENRYLKIIGKSLKETFTSNIWKWLLGGVGGPVTILLLAKNFIEVTSQQSIVLGTIALTAIFLIRFFLFLIRNLLRHFHFLYKESSYGDAIIALRDSFSRFNATKKKKKIDDTEFMADMLYLCNNLKVIFDKTTNSVCSVSIKVPQSGAIHEAASVTNFCRDTEHMKKRDNEIYRKTNHSIIGNTAYQKIFHNVIKENRKSFYYLNQNINLNPDYENTSKESYPNGIFPYKSELVYPIIPQIKNEKGNYDCLGFICIDCQKINCFDEKYDVAILESVSDIVYDFIYIRNLQKVTVATQ